MNTPTALDVIVRFPDPGRLEALSRSIFSVALQDYRPVTIHLVCRGFGSSQIAAVRRTLAPLMRIAEDAGLEFLSEGLQAGNGRYAAFLDVGDLIYPEGYRLLIAELEAAAAAVAFGGILNTDVSHEGIVPVTIAKRRHVQAGGLDRLRRDNVCPLHSFVLDRLRIAPEHLAFEDVEHVPLRICAHYPSSFRLEDKIVGESVSWPTRAF